MDEIDVGAENARALLVHTVAAFAAFCGPAKVDVKGKGKREIKTRACRIDAGGDRSLSIVEIPDSPRRLDVFDEGPRLRKPMRLYSVVELLDSQPPDTVLVVRVAPVEAWLGPT